MNALIGRNRAFRLLLAGSSVSMLGSRLTMIAYPMLVLYLTGSPFAAGWVAFAAAAPSVLIYMPAGALVDRWDPRQTMLVSEFGRGIAIAAVVVTLALGRPSILLLIAAAVTEGILEIFSALAEPRYVRSLVELDQASSASATIEARTHVAVLAGRPLGGFLFGLSPILPFLADAISFIFSVVTLYVSSTRLVLGGFPFRRDAPSPAPSDGPPVNCWDGKVPDGGWSISQLGNDTRAGLHWLRGDRSACGALALSAGGTLIFQALIIIFLADAHARWLPAAAMGLVLAASGVGGALGSVAAPHLRARANWPWIQIQAWTWCVAFALLALTSRQSFVVLAIVMIPLGFTGALGNIELSTYLTRNVAENMLGRVTSIGRLLSFAACAAGPILGGALVQRYDIQDGVYVLFGLTVVLVLLAACTPSMRAERGPATDSLDQSIPENPVPVTQS